MGSFPIFKWETPIRYIPEQKRGRWTIAKQVISQGSTFEFYETMFGQDSWKAMNPITLTLLKETRKWEEYLPRRDPPEYEYETVIWMSDSPGEYFGQLGLINRILPNFQESPKDLKQKAVLVGGLGLGIAPYILTLRRDISRIYIVEIDQDIVDMVWPYIQAISPAQLKLFVGDFLEVVPKIAKQPDIQDYIHAVIVDIWQTDDDVGTELYKKASEVVEQYLPHAQHLYWLFQEGIESKQSRKIYTVGRNQAI